MSLVQLQAAVVATIKARLPALREVKAHDGRFDIEELRTFAANAPAVRVAVLGTRRAEDTGTGAWDHEAVVAAFVVTRDERGLPRGEAAAGIVTALLALVPGRRWGVPGVQAAREVRADNLYSNKVQAQGVCLWGVTWVQPIRIGEDVWAEDGTFPAVAYARHADGRFQEVAVDLGADDAGR